MYCTILLIVHFNNKKTNKLCCPQIKEQLEVVDFPAVVVPFIAEQGQTQRVPQQLLNILKNTTVHIALTLIKPCTPVLTHCAIMHTGTHTLCHHAHGYSHIVPSCTPVLIHCAIMHTGTHILCNHAHGYSHIVQSRTPVLTHCAITQRHCTQVYSLYYSCILF